MMKRLEQVAALVVAAGLAIVSYWLFFSWAQGGGAGRREQRQSHQPGRLVSAPTHHAVAFPLAGRRSTNGSGDGLKGHHGP
jgi:hypothetical protein